MLLITLIYYIFGSLCAGTFNIKDWNETGRIILAIFWALSINNILKQ